MVTSLAFVCLGLSAGTDVWTTTFPFGGNMPPFGLAVDPANSNIVYIAPNFAGIYKSIDGGVNWTSITDPILSLPFDRQTIRIVAVQRISGALYASPSGGKIFRSMDQGATWTAQSSGITSSVQVIEFDPASPGTMYAGTQTGIFKTTDNAASWLPSSGPPLVNVTAISVCPSQPSVVFAATAPGGLFKSSDGGQTWATSGAFTSLMDVKPKPTDANVVYVAGIGPAGTGLYKTTDGGLTWVRLLTVSFLGGPAGNRLAVDPGQPDLVYAVTGNLMWKTPDGGAHWSNVMLSRALMSISLDPGNSSTIYATTNGYGIYKSVDAGQTWTGYTSGIRGLNFPHSESRSLEIDASNPKILYAGTIANGHRSTDGGQTWSGLNLPMPLASTLATHPAAPGVVYAHDGYTYKSVDWGANWTELSTPFSGSGSFNGALAFSPSSPPILYLACFQSTAPTQGVYKSTDGGSTWSLVNDGLANTTIVDLSVHPSDPNIVFAATVATPANFPRLGTGLYKTVDGGHTWVHLSGGLPDPLQVDQIVISPANPQIIYIASEVTNGGIYKSTDGGATWTKLAQANANAVAIEPADPNRVYFGTWNTDGFHRSKDGGLTWSLVNAGLPPNPPIETIAMDPLNPRHLYIGTGRGAYEITLSRTPVAEAGAGQTVSAGGNCQARVTLNGSGSSDPDGDTLTYSWIGPAGLLTGVSPTVTLPLGTHTFSLTVNDGRGETATDTVAITVVDRTPPDIQSAAATPNVLWPPNHKMVSVNLTVTAADLCSSAACRITGVTSNEPGSTDPDWLITGPLTVQLRAERTGGGDGRIYTLTVECTDAAGNKSTKTVTVTVPHDKS